MAAHKVVVIDDDPETSALVEKILASAGHEVVATRDSRDATALVKREAPDLVLCDVAMPGADGYEVLKRLRQDPATASCPVVFLTAHRDFSDRVRAFQAGVADFVPKPFTRDSLLRKVERLLQGEGQGSPLETLLGLEPPAPGEPVRDPGALPPGSGTLPSFNALPEALRTVLIAEDNPAFRAFLRALFANHGFAVHEAADGEEALRIALDKRPWLILADVSMPVMDGFQLCKRIKAHSLVSHTPFVFLSGWDDHRDRARGLQLGADEFLSKQTPVREMLIRIHLLLQRYSDASSGGSQPVMEGFLLAVGAPGILQMWHQSQLTGQATVHSGARVFQARFRSGEIVGASLDEKAGTEAVFEFLGWTRGRFRFVPGPPPQGDPIGGMTFDQLLLDGCRLLDERRNDGDAAGGS